ncbi:unnamed protein product, partial [Polarella glacialis]
CRFCGSGDFPACPKSFDCADGLLHKGLWSEDQRNWCCKHYSMGCPAPHECLKDIETWKDSWSEQKKSWCCNYQSVGCPNECSKMDPLDWSENHHFWCGTFGKTTDAFVLKYESSPAGSAEPAQALPANLSGPAKALGFLAVAGLTAMGAVSVSRVRRRSEEHVNRGLLGSPSDSETEVTVL